MGQGASWAPDSCSQSGDIPNSPLLQLAASMPSAGTAETAPLGASSAAQIQSWIFVSLAAPKGGEIVRVTMIVVARCD